MTVKITKRQYTLEMTRLTDKRTELLKEEELLTARYDACEDLSEAEYNRFDEITDAVYDLSQEINRLEDRWTTRNWTAAEWNSYDLMAANID